MKAIILKKYGQPELVMESREVDKPVPKKNEVLIRIRATAINDYDWSMVSGKPHIYRLIFGLFKPKQTIPGMELSGIVEAAGADAKNFKPGDAVLGDISSFGFGTFAEYLCVNENAVVHKPDDIGFTEAAALPHASLLAWQGLQMGKIKTGQSILINGAGGGVGTFALQFARLYGCTVTGVDSEKKLEAMKSLGFDHVMDYSKQDFTRTGLTYDLILDCRSARSPLSYQRALKPNGTYVTVGGNPSTLIRILLWSLCFSFLSTRKLKILALEPNKGLDQVCELVQQKKIRCMIDGPYPFEKIPELVSYFGRGGHYGKIVATVD